MIVLYIEWIVLLVCNFDILLYFVGLYEFNKVIIICMWGVWIVGYGIVCLFFLLVFYWIWGGLGWYSYGGYS